MPRLDPDPPVGRSVEGFVVHYATPRLQAPAVPGQPTLAALGSSGRLFVEEAEPTLPTEEMLPGAAFDRAYELRELYAAPRVEPLFDVPAPSPNERGIDEGPLVGGGDDAPGSADDEWSLVHVRAGEAWSKVRAATGSAEGQEAGGVLIGHLDTGFRHHPETWLPVAGVRPVFAEAGRNYVEGGGDAFDPLLDSERLDHPGHGTASGSVIVSPSGCQLSGAPGCVNGVARGARLVPVRVHRSVVHLSTKRLAQAILDVAEGDLDTDVPMISIAMGGLPSWSLWEAVREAERRGILIVAAAGNYSPFVVWPARFSSVIGVAATNVGCKPWVHSSSGLSVDVSAPGESVWRATLDEQQAHINGRGKGTTFATGHVAGAAALWLARYADDPQLQQAADAGMLTRSFRRALRASAWQPSGDPGADPPGTECSGAGPWLPDYGAGILDASALLDRPPEPTVSAIFTEAEGLPLFSTLYPPGTTSSQILADYRTLLQAEPDAALDTVDFLEAEVMYHYATDRAVATALEEVVTGGVRDPGAFEATREALRAARPSSVLRARLDG